LWHAVLPLAMVRPDLSLFAVAQTADRPIDAS
jgi:hypothetical protein